MAQAAPPADRREVRVNVRIPGWLLALAFLVLLGVFGAKAWGAYADSGDTGPFFGAPARVTVLEWDADGGILRARVLVEAKEALTLDGARWSVVATSDGPQAAVPAAAAAGASPGSSDRRLALVDVFATLPEGATPVAVTFHLSTGMSGSAQLPVEHEP